MYTPVTLKFNKRWRRVLWRMQSPYTIFLASSVISLAAVRSIVTYGPANTHRNRMEAEGTYKKRKFAEVGDNPLYRLPEQPYGGHRLDGLSPQKARAALFEHH